MQVTQWNPGRSARVQNLGYCQNATLIRIEIDNCTNRNVTRIRMQDKRLIHLGASNISLSEEHVNYTSSK